MNQICQSNHIHFIVVLQATKETVFRNKVHDTSRYKLYADLIKSENEVRIQLKAYFEENHIDFVDPLRRLQDADVQPFFDTADGHPNAAGQEIIAAAVYDFVEKKNEHTSELRPR